MKADAASPAPPRTYWPAWAIWVAVVWFIAAPLLFIRFLGVDGVVGFQLGWAPCWTLMVLFEPDPRERDPETGLPLPRTREGWARAWRKALIDAGILLAASVALYIWLLG